MEHENAKILGAKGELSDENASSYEKLRKSYEHLYRNVSSYAALQLSVINVYVMVPSEVLLEFTFRSWTVWGP